MSHDTRQAVIFETEKRSTKNAEYSILLIERIVARRRIAKCVICKIIKHNCVMLYAVVNIVYIVPPSPPIDNI